MGGITIIPDIQPHITSDITGKPLLIKSRRHKKEVMKRYGVVEFSPNSTAKNKHGFKDSKLVEWGKKHKRRWY